VIPCGNGVGADDAGNTVMRKWLANLFQREPPLAVDDSVFGKITFEDGYWSSETPYSPSILTVYVEAPESGPSGIQRDFFKKVMAGFREIEGAGRSFVDAHRNTNVPLNVYTLHINSDDGCSSGTFDIEYTDKETDKEADTIYIAFFVNWKPTHYGEND
jgi:hypothetical protein